MPAARHKVANAFTFLNYDNPDHSASHRRLVKSHISSKYRAAIRQQAQPRYALPHQAKNGEEQDSQPNSRRKRTQTSLESDASPICRWSRAPSPLEVSFSGTRADPFRSLPGQETPCVTQALDYYTQAISPLMQPLFLTVKMANPLMVWMYPLILSHESAYHCAVALSQAYLEKSRAPTGKASAEVTFHRRKAVSVLCDQLADLRGPPDDGVLMTVLALACLDVLYREDRIANRKGLALIVALKGGLDNLGLRGLVKAFLVQFDYFWMLETGARTIFPFTKRKNRRTYPHPPFKEDLLSMLATLPQGFAAIARQGSFGLDTIRILSRVSTFLQSKIAKLPRPMEEDPVSDGQDYPDLFEVCACLQSSACTEHSLEKNLILAVIMFGFDMHNPNGSISRVAAYRGSRQELTRSLPFTQAEGPEERACLVWIMMIVIRSWGLELPLADQAIPLGRSFFEQFPEARSWDAVESTMRYFFWYEPLEEGLRSSWQQALDKYQRESIRTSVRPVIDSTGASANKKPYPVNSPRRGGNDGHLQEVSEEDAVVTLPPMLTLDTYLTEVQSL
ncbi:Fungal specific transcription factor domain-containing protein [Cladophialophora immunda]|nr:Fungal specific transcription factor domain-containing protein [Cladophialophora immunda]